MDREDKINEEIKAEGIDTNRISDGYHSFGELYEHRIALFIALCLFATEYDTVDDPKAWKSRLHHDGAALNGWFIAGINTEKGKQISYHLPNEKWDLLTVTELDKAPEWDGHTPADVVKRLLEL